MPPIFMCGPGFGPRMFQQNITIKQSGGGFGQFLAGLFGGYTGMPMMSYPMGYIGPLGFVTPREQMQFQFYAQQMQLRQMSQMPYQIPMMNPAMQMNQYAYLNQMQNQQQFLMDGVHNQQPGQSNDIKNLETFFKDKGYIICPEADGKYTVADKDGKFLASGTYTEVRDKLFEINKQEVEDAEETDDTDDTSEITDDELDGDDEVTETRSQGTPSGWYKSTSDNYKYLKSIDVGSVNNACKKEGTSAARYIIGHFYAPTRFNGCLSMKQLNDLTEDFIKFNKDCFNADGSFKEGFSNEKLALPDTKWVMKTIVVREDLSPKELQNITVNEFSDYKSNPYFHNKEKKGNRKYHASLMAQMNYSETSIKGVYYNEKTKKCVYLFDGIDDKDKKKYRVVSLPGVKVTPTKVKVPDGSGHKIVRGFRVDTTSDEIARIAEQQSERSDSSSGRQGKTSTDNNGNVDSTNVFELGEDDDY